MPRIFDIDAEMHKAVSSVTGRHLAAMDLLGCTAPVTVTVDRRAIEAIIEQLIELLDTADANAAIEASDDCAAS